MSENMYEIWVDGSARKDKGGVETYAVGYVVAAPDQRLLCANGMIIDEQATTIDRALFAELRGAAMALDMLPGGSVVVLHTDRTDIDHYVRDLNRRRMAKKAPEVANLYGAFLAAINRHEQVSVVLERGIKEKYFRAAHNLAAKKTGVRGKIYDLGAIQQIIDALPDALPMLQRV